MIDTQTRVLFWSSIFISLLGVVILSVWFAHHDKLYNIYDETTSNNEITKESYTRLIISIPLLIIGLSMLIYYHIRLHINYQGNHDGIPSVLHGFDDTFYMNHNKDNLNPIIQNHPESYHQHHSSTIHH